MAIRQFVFGEKQINPTPIGALLTLQQQRGPDAPILTFQDRTLTRTQLEKAANRRARRLASLGVAKNDVVSLVLPNGPDFHVTTFAIWKLGATPAPLSHRLPEHELQAILALMQPKIIVGLAPERAQTYSTMDVGVSEIDWSDAPLESIAPTFTKAITSGGSTGRPKVIFDHAPGELDPTVIGLGMALDDTILMTGPLYHNAPFGITHRAMCRGGHVVEMPYFDPLEALALIERYRIRWVYLVPTMMRRIWALPKETRERFDLSSLEMAVHMAAPCPPWLKQAWIDWLGPDRIWEVYAGTERMGAVCIGGRDWLEHKGSVGRPAPGTVRVVAPSGELCPPGEPGEIMFTAPANAKPTFHYVGAELHRQKDWASYGDIGHFDEDGFLFIDDRRTDMIVCGGANVYPAEVEAALDAHPDVLTSVVVGLPDDDLGQRIHAIVEPNSSGSPPDKVALAAHLSRRLARYKLPATFEIVKQALRDESGKVRRSALREARMGENAFSLNFETLEYAPRVTGENTSPIPAWSM